MKTFWGWRDQQLPDGTIILNSPSGKTYFTTPGGALLFPSLCVPTGNLTRETDSPIEYWGDRNAMMPDGLGPVGKTAPAAKPNEDGTTLPARPVKPARSATSGLRHATPMRSYHPSNYRGRWIENS